MTAEDLPPFLPQKVEISQRNFLSLEGQSRRLIPIEVYAPKSVRVSQMYRGRGLILSGRQHATITATHFIIGHSRAHVKEQPDNPLSVVVVALSDDGGDVINPLRALRAPSSSAAQPNIDPAQSIGQTRLILRSISISRGGGRQCQQCLSVTLPGVGRCDNF